MIYEQIASGGCQSYLLGCSDTCAAVVIDPEISQIDRYLGLAARDGLRIHYLIDTHTHADHFSGTRQLARQLGVPVVTAFHTIRLLALLLTVGAMYRFWQKWRGPHAAR